MPRRVFQLPATGRARSPHASMASGAGRGRIVAGYIAPHPPHLVYAENPPQNEPRSTGGWEGLRWGYDEVRRRIKEIHRPDVIVVHAPHWITMIGHHVNCVPHPAGFSVEPIFPHLLRYHYEFETDVDLAEAIADEASVSGLVTRKMTNAEVRVDYATIGALHMMNPAWDIPVVSLSCNLNPYYFTPTESAALDQMEALGAATRRAIGRTGRRAVLGASNSLSHFHWDREPDLPEDMAAEHPYSNDLYRWDMELLDLIRTGRTTELRGFIPRHIEATASEIKGGALSWLLGAMDWPEVGGEVLAFGSIIGTGNAVVEWCLDADDSGG